MKHSPFMIPAFLFVGALAATVLVYREVPFVKDALTGEVGPGCAGVFELTGAAAGRHCFNGPGIIQTESGFFIHYSFGAGGHLFGYGAGDLPKKTEDVQLQVILLRPPGRSTWACAGRGILRKEGEDLAFNGALHLKNVAWLEPVRSADRKSGAILTNGEFRLNGSENKISEIFGHGCDQETLRCDVILGPETAPTRVFVHGEQSLRAIGPLREGIVLTENGRTPDRVSLGVTRNPGSRARFPFSTDGRQIHITLTDLSEPIVCPAVHPNGESIQARWWRRW